MTPNGKGTNGYSPRRGLIGGEAKMRGAAAALDVAINRAKQPQITGAWVDEAREVLEAWDAITKAREQAK